MRSYHQMMGIPRTEEYIGTGDTAIYNTVSKMKQIIAESSKNPYIREWARDILGHVDVNDKMNEARAVHNFVRDSVRYTKDPFGFEYIQTPPVLLEAIRERNKSGGNRPNGDCDDMTVLSLSLLKSIGFPVAIKVVSFHDHGRFSHVYGLVQIHGQWVPIDTVRPDKQLGWEADGLTRVMETTI